VSRARRATGAAIALVTVVMTATAASAAYYRTIARHGAWEAVVVRLSGRPVTGAVTHPCGDCRAAVFIRGGTLILRLSAPSDLLHPGDLARMRVEVDGFLYRGRAIAVNEQEFEARLTRSFQTAITDGEVAVIDIGRNHWTLDLNGLSPSLKDAFAYRFPFLRDGEDGNY